MKTIYRNMALFAAVIALALFATSGFSREVAMVATTAVGLAVAPHLQQFRLDMPGLMRNDSELTLAIANALATFKSTETELKGLGAEWKAKAESGEAIATSLTEKVDDLLSKFNEQKAAFEDMERKAASGFPGSGRQPEQKSVGEQFVESEQFKNGFKSGEKCSVKATISTTLAGGAAGNGLMTPAYRDNDLVRIPRRVTIDNLIPSIQVDSSSVDFARQLTRNNAAAMVAEGAAKPYSDYSWESATVPVRTLAHLAKVTRQAWEDAPRLMGEINSELIYGLDLLREAQVLFGTGVGQNLNGIVPQATEFARPAGAPTANLTRIDVIRLAVLNISLRGYDADGVVLNSADWAYIEMMKDAQQRYLIADPHSGGIKRLWNLPVLDTQAMAQDNFLVGAFRIGATLYRRMGIEVKLSTENDKDFEQNLGTVRAEERIAVAVKRAEAFETGNFTDAVAVVP